MVSHSHVRQFSPGIAKSTIPASAAAAAAADADDDGDPSTSCVMTSSVSDSFSGRHISADRRQSMVVQLVFSLADCQIDNLTQSDTDRRFAKPNGQQKLHTKAPGRV